MNMHLQKVVEALIFAADEPLSLQRIASIYALASGEEAPDLQDISAAIDQLNQEYQGGGRVFRIHAWAGGYRMATEDAVAPYVKEIFSDRQSRRLSRSVMETLSIVAYQQPVPKSEIDFIRGVDSTYAIKKLMDLGLADVVGRSEAVGKPLLYATTTHFLEQFGLSTLEDLPRPKEIEELLKEPGILHERTRLLMDGVQQGNGEATTEAA